MAIFGSSTPVSKIIAAHFPVFSASLLRMLVAAAVLAPFMISRRGELRDAPARDWTTISLIALAGMVGFTATQLFGMRLTTGVIGATVMSSAPAVTALAAVIFLGAAMNWRKGGALALAVIGVVLINVLRERGASGGEAVFLGALLVLIAVCFEAAFTLLSKRLSSGVSSLSATFAASCIAIPAFAALAAIFDPAPFAYWVADPGAWAAIIFWGAGTGALAPVIWYHGVRQAPGPLAAGFMAVMPVSALVLSYILLDESFRWAHLIGFGAVFAGVLLMVWEHAHASGDKDETNASA
ncbi:MAG: EamA family transporter [Alphaproteobacteria bacterium]|nr:EamA family transporter [Alphaproteobacteria bacterium]